MMSYEQISEMSRKAADRARRASKSPKTFVGLGQDAIRAEIRHIPFVGTYVSPRWQRVDVEGPRAMGCEKGYLFVDSFGGGHEDEPALTVKEFVDYIFAHPEYGYAIVEAGQFQVVIACYERKTEVKK